LKPELTIPAATPVLTLAEAKAYLRVDHDVDDALIAALIRSATDICEHFIGRVLLSSGWQERFDAAGTTYRLGREPVRAVSAVAWRDQSGVSTPIAADAHTITITEDGQGSVVLAALPFEATAIDISFTAGEASDPNGLPEAVRQGLLRLVCHEYDYRDSSSSPPVAVAALWRPFRRMRLA